MHENWDYETETYYLSKTEASLRRESSAAGSNLWMNGVTSRVKFNMAASATVRVRTRAFKSVLLNLFDEKCKV